MTHEDDNYIGQDLHAISAKVTPLPPEPWKGILPESLCEQIARDYQDINRLSAGAVLPATTL